MNIKDARKNAGIKAKDAAFALGVSYASLRNYELGKFLPTAETINRMSALYNVPVGDLDISARPTGDRHSKTRLYGIYQGIKQRCYNPNCNRYRFYGAIGVKMCEAWYSDYFSFCEWSKQNGYADDLVIDRIDSSKDYCPENCRWIPAELNSSLAGAKRYHRPEEWCFERWADRHRR